LGFQYRNLLVSSVVISLRGSQQGLALSQIGARLLRALRGSRSFLQQILGTRIFLLREGERGLRLCHLLGRLLYSRLLRVDLRLQIIDGASSLLDLRPGLGER